MSIYKFRVLLDFNEKKEVFRDIEIKSTQTFEELHQAILSSFNFNNSEMASFYVSDEDWTKLQEIALFDMNVLEEESENVLIMNETSINTQINCVGQHLRYTYDFLNMWDFYIELIKISVKEDNEIYPKLVHTQGEAPKQDSRNKVLNNDEISDEILKSSKLTEDEAPFDDDIFEGFDDFDDYQ